MWRLNAPQERLTNSEKSSLIKIRVFHKETDTLSFYHNGGRGK